MNAIKRLAFLFLTILCLGHFLQSCQNPEIEELAQQQLHLQSSVEVIGDYLTGGGPCSHTRSYNISFELLDQTEFHGHDLSIRILQGPPIDLDSCDCDSLVYVVTLNFPISQTVETGFKNISGPVDHEIAVKNNLGGFVGHVDPRHQEGTPNPIHSIAAPQDSNRVVYFDLDSDFPEGYDLRDAVLEVEGICIIENIEDTNDPKDPDPIGGGDDPIGGGNVTTGPN